MGFCHTYWWTKKNFLRDKYGIEFIFLICRNKNRKGHLAVLTDVFFSFQELIIVQILIIIRRVILAEC